MSAIEHFDYLVEEVNRADYLFKKNIPYDVVMMVKEQILLDILDHIKFRMLTLEDIPDWAYIGDNLEKRLDEFDMLNTLSDKLIELKDESGNLILEKGVFEKYTRSWERSPNSGTRSEVGWCGDFEDWDAYPDDWY